MRNLVLIVSVALIVLGACVAPADPVADKSGKFSIEVPTGWTQAEGQDLFNLAAANKISQVSISSQQAPKGLTLAMFQAAYVAEAKKALKGFTLGTQGKTTIDGTQAGVWVYTAVIEGVKLKFKNVVLFRDGQMYNIVFATLPDLYKQDSAGLDKMLASWKWLQSATGFSL